MELFDILIKTENGLDEPICRYIFKECLTAIETVHLAGFAHRDLKLDNILITKDYKIKIIDFNLSATLQIFNDRKGTREYWDP